VEIDRQGLAEFLRHRRSVLQPEDVGLPRGRRRRTEGLRREEAAALSHMSPDYFARLERGQGPRPSEQMIAAIAQGLHLSPAERDHLFRLAGHPAPAHDAADEHVSPGMLRVLDRLHDTPAEIVTELGETLRQSPLGVALTGDTAALAGPFRSIGYRWFAAPESRGLYDPADHEFLSRLFVSGLREIAGRRGPGSRAARLAEQLLAESAEFRELWERHEVGVRRVARKRFAHPEVGLVHLTCEVLLTPETDRVLLVYFPTAGTDAREKLDLLRVIGTQQLHPSS
jgi:transcriptional regulator with XRE-family HTH domain